MGPQLPPQCMSGCILDNGVADDRQTLFTTLKKSVLDPLVPSKSEDTGVPIDLGRFVALLQQFAGNPDYGGMRIYFAAGLNPKGSPHVPDGREGKLTLIVAPTLTSSTPGGDDDATAYYHLYDQIELLPIDIVTQWINHYRDHRRGNLLTDGLRADRAGAGFRETTSLWYSMSTIAGIPPIAGKPDTGDIGMIGAIQCGTNYKPNPVISLTADFGCFLKDEKFPKVYPFYQLTVTFNLHQQQDPVKPVKFGSGRFEVLLDLAPADTGVPCPPATSCPTGGSGFPPPTP